jgi:predicted metal-binding membrane protein
VRTLQTSQRFMGISAALFFGSAALTVAWCGSMSALHDMPMCSGRTRSAPGLLGYAFHFLLMWLTMMVAMMLPSLMPILWRFRQFVSAPHGVRLDVLTACVGAGYFFVWSVFGACVFAGNTMLTDWQMRAPSLAGIVIFIAGALQFSRWKERHLACCRATPGCCDRFSADIRTAWRHGVRLGLHCVHCCFGLTVVLLAVGMMDLRAMALVTAAISVERLAPNGLLAARWIGGILIAAGLFLIAQ